MRISDWSSDVCSSDLPLATGEIIATDFDGRNQLYVFGYQVRKTGIDRGFGIIEGMPPVRNGHFYMRHRAENSSRSMLYDMDSQRGTHRLVAQSEEHTSELQSPMRTSYAFSCLKKKPHQK